MGFGGAFTDSTGLNIKTLSKELQNQIIDDYFSEKGIQYNLGRIPIGGADCSTHGYSYDDDHPGDFEWNHWNLTKEDFDYKVFKLLSQVLFHINWH